ncbi:sensor histidine kinase [Spirochaeta isovalerica]|uniref:histidine kinase n=1 Tax=Spirochaeta isovalerica TaxID=150 RepID=A0A841RGG2_9SPIO|nr:ATP-binding protein [Spirochaeta isovalerica]MBB6482307.1 nitrogen fixation/metabolism regulation signal transduction histidine kinase [Spirochaeta isovalerica]
MRLSRPRNLSIKTLYSAILLYLLIIVLFLFFTDQVLEDINSISQSYIPFILPLAIVMPLFLMIFIIYYLIKLKRMNKVHSPGIRLKSRLILFFSIIILFSAIPQTILSFKYIKQSTDKWFDDSLGDALESGLEIALDYHRSYIDDLNDLYKSPEITSIIFKYREDPSSLWTALKGLNNSLSSMQFAFAGDELFSGDEDCRIENSAFYSLGDGIQPKRSVRGVDILGFLKILNLDGTELRILCSIRIPDKFNINTARLTFSIDQFQQYKDFQEIFPVYALFIYLFFALPLIFLAILTAFTLSDDVTVPLERLEKATRRVAEGDYSFRILSPANDELSLLTTSFNEMINELELSRIKILQTEKVTTWQEIAQRLAHEIRNPLTPIKLSAQRVLRKKDSPNVSEILETSMNLIINEVQSLDNMLQQFRDFARLPKIEPVSIALESLIRESTSMYNETFPAISLEIEEIDATIRIHADRNQLKQVFINLITNAIEAMNGVGTINIRTDIVQKGYTRYCRIQIQDHGSGIAQEDIPRVFHPYYTTKENGTGLGLSIIERIIFDHKGRIWLESQMGSGTTFYIDLPVEVEE